LASIVDASVFSKWYLRDERFAAQAMDLLESYRAGEEPLLCPQFARYELASAVTKAANASRISREDASAAMSDFAALGITAGFDADQRISAAADLSARYRLSFYDSLYLALAREFDARLVTADDDVHKRTRSASIDVVHLSDLP
jgi:predicted nucleic acid-binding protein